MNLETFRALVYDIARFEGQPYLRIDQTAELNALIQEQLDVYCADVECLTSDIVTMTPVVGKSTGTTTNTTDTAEINFGSRVAKVDQVFLQGVAMASYDSAFPGASSDELAARRYAGYQVAQNGKPQIWWWENPNKVRFNCPFDQVYANCFVSGVLYHTLLTRDMQELDLGVEDNRPAARLCASELLMVHSRSAGTELQKVAKDEMVTRKGKLALARDGSTRRQSTSPTIVSLR